MKEYFFLQELTTILDITSSKGKILFLKPTSTLHNTTISVRMQRILFCTYVCTVVVLLPLQHKDLLFKKVSLQLKRIYNIICEVLRCI